MSRSTLILLAVMAISVCAMSASASASASKRCGSMHSASWDVHFAKVGGMGCKTGRALLRDFMNHQGGHWHNGGDLAHSYYALRGFRCSAHFGDVVCTKGSHYPARRWAEGVVAPGQGAAGLPYN